MPRLNDLLNAVDTYFRAVHACDLALLDGVFHPASSLFNSDGDTVKADPIAAYRDVIAARISPESEGQPREDEILMLDWLSAEQAVVKVRLRLHDKTFIDYLCFALDGQTWRIVAKTWHLEKTH